MTLYWLLLMVPWLAAIGKPRFVGFAPAEHSLTFGLLLYFVMLVLIVGLRHQVGGDWYSYLNMVDAALQQSFEGAMAEPGDTAYKALTWISVQSGTGIYGVNLVCAFLFAYGLLVFCRNSPRPWLSIAVAVPYLVIVVAMGYTRQGVAIGLIMLALAALDNSKMLTFGVWVVVASLFHKTALIMIPMAIFSGRKNWVAILGVLLTGLLMFYLLLVEYIETFVVGYIDTQYASSGATVRIAMNALPAFVFLIFRSKFNLTEAQRVFWSWMSIWGLIFIFLLAMSPSSTAVDRVALYWIPLQLYVLSRWPAAMAQAHNAQLPWVAVVLAYSLAVQFIWLFYADHSGAWVPYQFYPWVWLWQ